MKKLLLFAGLVSLVAVSCNKNVETTPAVTSTSPEATKTVIQGIVQPTPNFSITFDGNGGYSTSDANYINSFPQVKNAVITIAASIQNGPVSIMVNDQGTISSLNTNFDGLQFMTMMKIYGNFYFSADANLSIVFGKDGFKSISSPELLDRFPAFKQRLIENGEVIRTSIVDGKDITISLTANNDLLVNGKVISTTSEDLYEFKMCMRYYWWMTDTMAYLVCSVALLDL